MRIRAQLPVLHLALLQIPEQNILFQSWQRMVMVKRQNPSSWRGILCRQQSPMAERLISECMERPLPAHFQIIPARIARFTSLSIPLTGEIAMFPHGLSITSLKINLPVPLVGYSTGSTLTPPINIVWQLKMQVVASNGLLLQAALPHSPVCPHLPSVITMQATRLLQL